MVVELPGPPAYCNKQLIPYLGNKRALLPRLMPVLERLKPDSGAASFLDPFSGSGSVSRLARAMGMNVAANDWEPYAEAINSCWLALSLSDVEDAFGGGPGLVKVLEDWNSMHPQAPWPVVPESARGIPYMARWYAPLRTEEPRLGDERLFYTAENAVFIDRVRTRIQSEYPNPAPGTSDAVKRTVLLACLLLEAATHANTSGVFKAYHRGFGGNSKDALGRIMGRMELEIPILPNGYPAAIAREDAKIFLSGISADIIYFDPPYNQHQYGSNYHILNTILRWDGKPLPLSGGESSCCSRKAGIPDNWKATRSRFCSRPAVKTAIHEVLDVADAAHLVFSWNADGYLPGEELADMLSARGRLEILALDYTAYRGGRQSVSKNTGSREYLFVVDTRSPGIGSERAIHDLQTLASGDDAVRATYDPERVASIFALVDAAEAVPELFEANSRETSPGDQSMARQFFRPDLRAAAVGAASLLAGMDGDRRQVFMDGLASCACSDSDEQLVALHGVIERALTRGDRARALRALREVPRLIRKFAHRKYEDRFMHFVEIFRSQGLLVQDRIVIESLSRLEQLKLERTSHDRQSGSH
jgi:adenine-specific DNA-methyltransferase